MHAFHPVCLARVALLSPPYAELSYLLPAYLPLDAFAVGQRVAVPLGRGLRAGIITGFEEPHGSGGQATAECPSAPFSPTSSAAPATNPPRACLDAPGSVRSKPPSPAFTLKSIAWPLEKTALLSGTYLDLVQQLANRQGESPGRIMGTILPAGLRSAQARIRFFSPGGKPRDYKPGELAALPPEAVTPLAGLWQSGMIEIRRTGVNPLDNEICLLTADPPWPVRPAAKAQTALLEYLYEHGPVSRRKLMDALGKGCAATLATLTDRGLVHIRPAEEALYGNMAEDPSGPAIAPPIAPAAETLDAGEATVGFTLTPEQETAFRSLRSAALSGRAETHLLFGITGSGKTAIYLELARAVLAAGRSVLLLAPEVALALKLWGDASAVPLTELGPERRLLFHGYQSASSKEAAFRAVSPAGGDVGPRLVIGTRSALLLPLENVGLIILDEEHDASFKQDEGLNYQAKEVAWYRAKTQNALLLMGSATPDVKSFQAARQGLIPMHILSERVGGGAVPEVRLVSLPKGAKSGLLAEESLECLRAVVEREEQAVILLNRRGYAPLMYCLSCSQVVRCPHCDIALAYHKGRERLLCHYCGYAVPYPSPCSSCKGVQFLPMGEGTEKLEESLSAALPAGCRVLRLDRDSTRRPGRMEEILGSFSRKEASILVGTQMLSKGHHFPDVTLAVVADADLGLNLPDYRAAERTFQLLLQSAGRAGRGQKPGQVLIQTRDPAHYCWEYVRNGDYEGFFERELALRQTRRYPPFVRLALIRISCPVQEEEGQSAVTSLGKSLRQAGKELDVTVLGPAPAPIPLLKGRRRWHCMLKAQDWPPLRSLFSAALSAAAKTPLRLRLDLDPVNML